MKITNIGHPSYRVSDRDKALEFYCGCLGLKKKFTISYPEYYEFSKKQGRPEELLENIKKMGDKIWITYLEVAPHQFIELFIAEGGEEKYNWSLQHFDHLGYLHLALEVEDIHAAYEELKAKGVKIINAPNMGIENAWQFWIEDPDGNSIELMQYEKDAWQNVGHCAER